MIGHRVGITGKPEHSPEHIHRHHLHAAWLNLYYYGQLGPRAGTLPRPVSLKRDGTHVLHAIYPALVIHTCHMPHAIASPGPVPGPGRLPCPRDTKRARTMPKRNYPSLSGALG